MGQQSRLPMLYYTIAYLEISPVPEWCRTNVRAVSSQAPDRPRGLQSGAWPIAATCTMTTRAICCSYIGISIHFEILWIIQSNIFLWYSSVYNNNSNINNILYWYHNSSSYSIHNLPRNRKTTRYSDNKPFKIGIHNLFKHLVYVLVHTV